MTKEKFEALINDNFAFIEKQCFRAILRKLPGNSPIIIENEALELSSLVLDELQKDNFKVLRAFKGQAKLTSYLTAVIAHKTVEMIRKKRGRSREKERAKEFGNLGELIYKMVFVNGYSVHKTKEILKLENGILTTIAEIEKVKLKIIGKTRKLPADQFPEAIITSGPNNALLKSDELIIPDNKHNPENKLIKDQLQDKQRQLVRGLLRQLNGQERLILSMRFLLKPGEEKKRIEEIGALLGVSGKAVYNRLARILKKCRESLNKSGIFSNELF